MLEYLRYLKILTYESVYLFWSGYARIGGYGSLEEKFLGSDAWPNFTRTYESLKEGGKNVSDVMEKYAKCGKL